MKKFLVPVAVAAAAFGNATASPNQEPPEITIERHASDGVSGSEEANVLAPLLMIPAVANMETITQLPQHRSHSSHGSHRSHYSSRF